MAKTLKGTIVSDKMNKTVVVKVDDFKKHPRYSRYYKSSKKYKAHDEKNEFHIGDKVLIKETRPLSKDKSFAVIKKI
ncbi:MAG: 30S ribosomal protein S17 [bacterium]|nr:30S ribosomal protein S17 [bacterium]